jgi:thiosulfate sulfurtransferase
MSYQCISVDQAKKLIASTEVTLADIRDVVSFSTANILHSIHVTRATVADFLSQTSKDKPLIVYCYHGNMSKGAAEFFSSEGFTQVYSMDGGFEDWESRL